MNTVTYMYIGLIFVSKYAWYKAGQILGSYPLICKLSIYSTRTLGH